MSAPNDDDLAPTDPEIPQPVPVIYFPKPGSDDETRDLPSPDSVNFDDFDVDVDPTTDNDPVANVESVNFDDFDDHRPGADDPGDIAVATGDVAPDQAAPLETPEPATIDAATVDLRANLTADIGRLADELTAIAAAERDDALRTVLDTAAQQLTDVRETAADVRAQDAERVTQVVGDLSGLIDQLNRR